MSNEIDDPRRRRFGENKFFLAKYISNFDNYNKNAGFVIVRSLPTAIIPDDLDRAGEYFILEIVRYFEVTATTTHTIKEKK